MTVHTLNRPALPDSDVNAEWVLQQRVRNWVAAGLRLIDEVNDGSGCGVTISRQGFEDFVHDELPVKLTELGGYDFTAWDEKINEAVRGIK